MSKQSDLVSVSQGASGDPLFIDTVNDRVGIGTSSPSENLDVRGAGTTTIAVRTTDTSGANVGQVRIDYTGGGGGTPSQVDLRAGDAYTYLVSPTNIPMLFGTNNAERMRITNIGDVGIGTSSPVAKNHIRGSGTSGQVSASWILENFSSGTAGMDITGAAGASRWRYLYGGGPGTGTNALTEAMCILTEGASAGNVGIGTTSPAYNFVVSAAGASGIEFGPAYAGTANLVQHYSRSGGVYVDAVNVAAQHRFDISGTERARIDASGNLLVGTTTPLGAKQVNLWDPVTESGLLLKASGGTFNGSPIVFYNSSNGLSGFIGQSASAVSYNTSSDYRLKENVVPLAGAADRLAQIPVHQFNFIADPDTTVDGFLAHEVQAFVPECVTGEKDQVETVDVKDEDGNVIGTEERPVYQGIDQSKLVPLLTAALQEALQKIDALETRISALETN